VPASLERLARKSTPLLEGAFLSEEESRFDTGLQLRGPVCGLSTAALQLYWQERHGIALERRIATPAKAPRGLNSRRLNHVALFDESTMVDPSFGQFFAYVGLSREAVRANSGLDTLYPSDKVAVVPVHGLAPFADAMAAHMHAIEPEVARRRAPDVLAYAPDKSLVGTSLDEKQAVLRDIWNPDNYAPAQLEDESTSFQRRALRLVERMYELEDSH
jgi:hypothetical protein